MDIYNMQTWNTTWVKNKSGMVHNQHQTAAFSAINEPKLLRAFIKISWTWLAS